MVKNTNTNTTVSEVRKIDVNDRTTLAVCTGGIDSSYLLHLTKEQFKEVGANLSDLIPIWFEACSPEQKQSIVNISKYFGLEPLFLEGSPSYSPKDYLTRIARYCIDNGIRSLYVGLNVEEELSPIAGLDVGVIDKIETEVKDAKRKELVDKEGSTEKQFSDLIHFHIHPRLLGHNKAVIIRRLVESGFDLSKCYRHISPTDEVITADKDPKKEVTVNKTLNDIRRRAFNASGKKDPLVKG